MTGAAFHLRKRPTPRFRRQPALLVTNAVSYLFDVGIRFPGHNDLILSVSANLVTTERAPAACRYDYSFGSIFADFIIRKYCPRTTVNKESRQCVAVDVVMQILTARVIGYGKSSRPAQENFISPERWSRTT